MVIIEDRFLVFQRRACRMTKQHRNTKRRPVPPADIEVQKLKRRIRELARRLDGWSVNHKRVQRISREEGLQRPLPRKRRRARSTDGSRDLLKAEYLHQVWANDFQFDQTMDDRTLKLLNMIDTIEELLKLYSAPIYLRLDNGP